MLYNMPWEIEPVWHKKDYDIYDIFNETGQEYPNEVVLFDIWYKECTQYCYHATIYVYIKENLT